MQAISKSGTNTNSGSFYGNFRSDKFNAPDAVANVVLPYSNQQIGGTFGGPIVKDKLHYFASYEYEREPGTIFTSPSQLPGQTFTHAVQDGQKSLLARVDDQLSANNRLSFARIAMELGATRSSSAPASILRTRRCRPRSEKHPRHLVDRLAAAAAWCTK